MVAKMTKGGLFSYLRAYLTHITPYKLFIRLFFVEKQKLVVHPHKNVQRVFSYLYWEFWHALLLFIPYRWGRGYGRDAIPSYLRFTTKITIKLTHRNHDKPNQKQSFQCARTHDVWFISIKARFPTHLYIISLQIELKCVPLHRQKVNRLFRLVVIDLGF